MKIITRTIWGSQLQNSLLLGLPHRPVPNSTLNERFDIQAGVMPSANENPFVRYLAIGNGGHRNMVGADGAPYTAPVNHRASDASLFRPMPFVLREVTNDLTVTERTKYALRKAENHNGRNYFAYYLRRLDLSNTIPELQHTTVVDGVSSTVPYASTSANLNPTQPNTPPTGVISTTGNYLSTSAIVPVLFTEKDVQEFIEVAKIMYDNEYMAVISELAFCSGVDKDVTGVGVGSASFTYKEAIAVQVATFITAYYSMGFTNRGFDFQVELGATEPMLSEADAPLASYLTP